MSVVSEGTLDFATTASVELIVGLFRAAKDALAKGRTASQVRPESSNPGLSL